MSSISMLGIAIVNITIWSIYGLIIGLIVHLLDRKDVRGGIISTMLLGIVGSIMGGLFAVLLFGKAVVGWSLQGFATAIAGGLVLAFIHRIFFRNNNHIKTMTIKLR